MSLGDFDWVIVGAGSAGSVLAKRLSEDGRTTVAVVEAGGPDRSPLIRMPMGLMWLMRGGRYNYGFRSVPQKHLDGRQVPLPRGRTLGGSSSINGMIYIRGTKADYDGWGVPGWTWDDVLPWFRRSERNASLETSLHGTDGELWVSSNRDPHPLNRRFVAAGQALQIPETDDFNGPRQEGLGLYQTTTRNGRRWSAADAFLRDAMARPNVELFTGLPVRRVILRDGRATGIETPHGRIGARAGVILAAGAFASPQILQLSGIGDPAHLARLGVETELARPAVGRNLQDHPNVTLMHRMAGDESYGLSWSGLPRVAAAALSYATRRRGMFASNVVEAGGFARTEGHLAEPDVQFHFVPFHRSTTPGRIIAWGHGFALHVCVLRPTSRGTVMATDTDPATPPEIDVNMMATEDDRAALIRGVRLARRIIAAPPLADVAGTEVVPGAEHTSDEDIMAFIRRACGTVYHPVGTCRMGTDADAVVDPELRVRGIDGLRVIDASIMPNLISGNTNAAAIMIGEKGADLILRSGLARAA